ncbi:MAG: YraN family protein [Candidatus Binatia bacterium]
MPRPVAMVRGAAGERAAEQHLIRARYVILARNYRCPQGEIDLVALDGRTVAFVEVKTRRGPGWGPPIESVTPVKQRRLRRAAEHFLVRHGLSDRLVRFDVVAVWLTAEGAACELVRDAFTANG